MNPSIPLLSALLPIKISKKNDVTDASVDQNLDTQNCPFQRISTNPGYCMNLSISSARLSIRIKNKKKEIEATVDQYLDTQNRPNNSAPFNISL